jgi:hypothetical protein
VIDMPFEHACFISYRHSRVPGVQKTYETFRDALDNQVGLYLPIRVYLDTGRISGGDFFNKELAFALCRSVCMISLYVPYYFDTNQTYCAREYQAMVRLEKQRLLAMPKDAQGKGLIIPIVIRGTPPDEITKERQTETLELLAPGDLRKTESRQALDRIAKNIFYRHEAFRMYGTDPCGSCEDFDFPNDGEVMEWLTGITAPPQKLPWRP